MIHTTVSDSDYCSRHAGASGLVRIILVWYKKTGALNGALFLLQKSFFFKYKPTHFPVSYFCVFFKDFTFGYLL